MCTLHLSNGGAIGPRSTNPATSRGTVSVAAGSGRVAFAWKDTSGTGVPKGIYSREYFAVGGWGPSRLISCLQTAAPCGSAPAPLVYNEAAATSVALFGTSGIGVTWVACPYTPTTPTAPCNDKTGGSNADPGSEILFKESWNDGATWWAGVSGSYERIVANTYTNSEVNEFPTLAYDKPGAAAGGCAMGTQGPEVGCVRYIYYMGRSKSFFDYVAFLNTGTQT